MRVLIDIPEELANKEHWYTDKEIWTVIKAAQNGTPIPDNATNGEVIKAMFPNIVVEEQSKDLFIVFNMDFQGTPFYKTWWNAPYQKGGKE